MIFIAPDYRDSPSHNPSSGLGDLCCSFTFISYSDKTNKGKIIILQILKNITLNEKAIDVVFHQ